jgi:glycosyltransferase involved in cell wall biosynthesis
MRLLHIIASMDPISGGPSQGIRTLNEAMQKMGVIREVVCLDPPGSAYLPNDNFKIHAIGPAKGPWNYSPDLSKWLNANISRFDVVIINGLWLYPSYATWKVIKNIKRRSPDKKLPKVLVMSHGMLDPYFQVAKERKLKALRNWLYWKLIENKVVNDADGLLFTCETELLLARQTFKPYHPKNEYNVGYGIAPPPVLHHGMTEAFNELCPGLMGKPYLLFLSRIHPKKGVDMLIKAYISLHKSITAAGGAIPKLVIAGPGIDTAFGKLIQQLLIQEPVVQADVLFPGMLSGNAKWGAFYGCEAFVLPSHQENFGLAVVEALACGKAVLISDQVNIWREIEKEGGAIVAPDTLEGTLGMLKQWLNMGFESKTSMGSMALSAYLKNFEINEVAHFFLKALS